MPRTHWRQALCLVAAFGLAGCGSSAPREDPATGSPMAIESAAASSPAELPPGTAAPSPEASGAAGLAELGGTWVAPAEGSKLTSYKTRLSAIPTATGPGVTFTKVVFRVKPAGGKRITVCTATSPGDDGTWSCKADLLGLGVPPGTVKLSFEVAGTGAVTPSAAGGSREVTYAVAPPKPAKARWEDVGARKTGRYEITRTYRVRWSAPAGYATEFLLYNTWACPRDSARNVGKPCFVAGTPVDTKLLEPLGTAPGDARSMKVKIVEPECGPSFGTVLLRARNAYGDSAFAIIEVQRVPDPTDMIC